MAKRSVSFYVDESLLDAMDRQDLNRSKFVNREIARAWR